MSFDCETTILNNGNPWTKGNKLCIVGIEDEEGSSIYKIEYDDDPYGWALKEIKRRIEKAYLLIGFNIKFDLHWIKKYVPDLVVGRIYDCQLAEYLLSNQSTPYPSLDGSLARFRLGCKLDVVATEYWERGIDTPQVPFDVLAEYCARDVSLTLKLFHEQKKLFTGTRKRLLLLQCEDIKGLQLAEQNGLRYDFNKAAIKGKELQEEIKKIDEELCKYAGTNLLNFGSSDQLSALLYGGIVYERYREPTVRILKSGEEKHGERWSERPIVYPRLVTPLKGTESDTTSKLSDRELGEENKLRVSEGKKPTHRVYSTAAPTLSRLHAAGRGKAIIECILKRSELEKLDSTYYTGLLNKKEEMGWEGDEIHGQFNTCVAQTGRLSSSNPNLQNMAGDIKDLFYSRYE